uniref:Uncharacterized protein n=1 Tax=Candidatus Kentrum sp. SD TaxID=2126332 RepID=A0A450Z919_9GAMM|nr:MAG: hypothetical protein BECKSD772F_GA0070984_13832 [Candidatus Kentron sp. SD]VFK50273.1 MAG: hypothetical protein BECKSD772E_GA0070983_13632 [Candidatus Kentron sp. SD]
MNPLTYEEVLSLFKETDLRMQETGRQIEELGYRFRELERVTKEQSKQISAIGDKFGYFYLGQENRPRYPHSGPTSTGKSSSSGTRLPGLFGNTSSGTSLRK